jgi:hypothetical protein
MRTSIVAALFTISNSPRLLVPAPAFLRPGFASLLHSPPLRGRRSAERRSGARRNTRGRARNAGRTPPGAPPWRFWALRVPRFPPRVTRLSRSFGGSGSVTASSSRPGRSAWRAGSLPPGAAVATAGRHTSLRIQDASRTRPQRARLECIYYGCISKSSTK